jgi:NTP pyrophosphatase (non-canonical NTP hydrolase)
MVAEFMYSANQKVRTDNTLPTNEELRFCFHLMFEEVTELFEARNIIAMADALGDILYTCLWTANHLNLKPFPHHTTLRAVLETTKSKMIVDQHEVNFTPLITRDSYKCLQYEQLISKHISHFIIDGNEGCREFNLTFAIETVLCYSLYLGMPLVKIFNEIHASNMSKFIDGHLDDTGKWRGGPSAYRPNLEQFFLQ